MIRLAMIADDLTGANDTGVQFRKYGMKTVVLLKSSCCDEADVAEVVVVDTDSRAIAEEFADARVRTACRMFIDHGVKNLYKKIDSTLRGNLGAEIGAVWEEYQPVITIIAPAFPKTGRHTVGGYQLIYGVPISHTEIAHDPKTPVHESYLPQLLANYGGNRLGTVSLHTVDEGPEAIGVAMRKLVSSGKTWIICDAVCEENLRHIAEAALPFGKILWVGSAGLAEQLALAKDWVHADRAKEENWRCRSVLVAAGSMSETTRKQISRYIADTAAVNFALDPISALREPRAEGRRLSSLAAPLLKEKNIVLSCSNEQSTIDMTTANGAKAGLTADEIGGRIALALGVAVTELVEQGADGLFLTGGESAASCCRELEATGLEICQEIVPGIPLGKLVGGPHQGLPIVTKAGAFGDPQAISWSVDTLKGRKINNIKG